MAAKNGGDLAVVRPLLAAFIPSKQRGGGGGQVEAVHMADGSAWSSAFCFCDHMTTMKNESEHRYWHPPRPCLLPSRSPVLAPPHSWCASSPLRLGIQRLGGLLWLVSSDR